MKLGCIGHLVDFNKLSNWDSKIFEITEIQSIEHLSNGDTEDSYLDQKFNKTDLGKIVTHSETSDITIAIMKYRFIDNFYMHRIGDNCVAISLYGISNILNADNISIENFILKQIYEICAIKCLLKDFSDNEVYAITHRDTRGCLFDLNGDREDILYNTEQPIICESCKSIFKKKQVNSKIVLDIEKELKRIRKPWILRIEKSIKKHPFFSVLISGFIAVFLSIIANIIWDIAKMFIKI